MVKKQKLGGFTLIEVLVVVLIIGILTSIALPQYQKSVFKARMAEAETLVNTLYYALVRYYTEHNYTLPPVANGSRVPADFEPYLDVSIPPLKSYFTLRYYSDNYMGISYQIPSGKTIYITYNWKSVGFGNRENLYCGFSNADSSDTSVRKYCASICSNSGFEPVGDGIACRIG